MTDPAAAPTADGGASGHPAVAGSATAPSTHTTSDAVDNTVFAAATSSSAPSCASTATPASSPGAATAGPATAHKLAADAFPSRPSAPSSGPVKRSASAAFGLAPGGSAAPQEKKGTSAGDGSGANAAGGLQAAAAGPCAGSSTTAATAAAAAVDADGDRKANPPPQPDKPPLPVIASDQAELRSEADPNRPAFGPPAPGALRFHAIRNDGSIQSMVWLLQLKQIFSRQLPKMPPQYITRLIFDSHHISLCLFKGLEPIGGISYRPFYEHEYAEIAFCAITARQQIQGFGTMLMNHLKAHVKPTGLKFFLTYADNFATEYFAKQGFSKTLTLRKKQWEGLIKHYDGANLMECAINHDVDYTAVRRMLRCQRDFVYNTIRDHTDSAVVYAGLPPGTGKDGAPPLDPYSIPGVREAGWEPGSKGAELEHTGPKTRARRGSGAIGGGGGGSGGAGARQNGSGSGSKARALQTGLTSIFTELTRTKFVWPFLKPVDPEEYPDYYEMIKEPMDLTMVKRRVMELRYSTKEQFLADIVLMCDNCRAFNPTPGNDYARCADNVEEFVRPRVNTLAAPP